jgi:hypothetical protein
MNKKCNAGTMIIMGKIKKKSTMNLEYSESGINPSLGDEK